MSVVSGCFVHLLAFSLNGCWFGREELRRRFVKAETALFRVRYGSDLADERDQFLRFMKFDWSKVCQDLFPGNKPLIQCTQITEEEGIALRDQLNTLINPQEEKANLSGFLKAY